VTEGSGFYWNFCFWWQLPILDLPKNEPGNVAENTRAKIVKLLLKHEIEMLCSLTVISSTYKSFAFDYCPVIYAPK